MSFVPHLCLSQFLVMFSYVGTVFQAVVSCSASGHPSQSHLHQSAHTHPSYPFRRVLPCDVALCEGVGGVERRYPAILPDLMPCCSSVLCSMALVNTSSFCDGVNRGHLGSLHCAGRHCTMDKTTHESEVLPIQWSLATFDSLCPFEEFICPLS